MRNCKDSTGAVTGLPDIPFVSTALVQQCSDQSFPIAPPQVGAATKDDHPQTFQADVARGHYYLEKYGKDNSTACTCSAATPSRRVTRRFVSLRASAA